MPGSPVFTMDDFGDALSYYENLKLSTTDAARTRFTNSWTYNPTVTETVDNVFREVARDKYKTPFKLKRPNPYINPGRTDEELQKMHVEYAAEVARRQALEKRLEHQALEYGKMLDGMTTMINVLTGQLEALQVEVKAVREEVQFYKGQYEMRKVKSLGTSLSP